MKITGQVEVLLPRALDSGFDYLVPGSITASIGNYVLVSVGRSEVIGVIWRQSDGKLPASKCKNIIKVFEDIPPLGVSSIDFINWVAWYNAAKLGMVLKMMMPTPKALFEPDMEVSYELGCELDFLINHSPLEGESKRRSRFGGGKQSNSLAQNSMISSHAPTTLSAACSLDIVRSPRGGEQKLIEYFSKHNLKITNSRLSAINFLSQNTDKYNSITAMSKQSGVGASVYKWLIDNDIILKHEVLCEELLTDIFFDDSEVNKPDLSENQKQAASELESIISQTKFSTTLLEGVTGSGKTEIYFAAIENILKNTDKQILVMLPEIILSVQWLSRFEKHFGFAPVIWHSSVGEKQRRISWRAVAKGKVRVIVGARSALFLPFPNLGLVVVDEEHESSYKQEDNVIYNARDMAVARAYHGEIPIVLVSATPSIETLHNVEIEKYNHIFLPARYGEAILPDVFLVDMRQNKLPSGQFISAEIKDNIKQTLGDGQQVLLFLNRRGYAPLVLCRTCGYRFECPNCSSWLVMHRSNSALKCHHCDYGQKQSNVCPDCEKEDTLVACGPGVERIEGEVQKYFPDAKIATVASDYTSDNQGADFWINEISENKVDIIIGTQMLAKGHHFPSLTMVGVIDADAGLAGGDVRSSEKTYQLLQQIGGRAGRENLRGKVFVQTYYPENPVMVALKNYDNERFIALEKQTRMEANLPPYGKLVAIIIEARNESEAMSTAKMLAANFPISEGVTLLGPAQSPIYRLQGLYRYRLLIKTANNINVQKVISSWLGGFKPSSAVKIKVDIDPYNFL